MALTTTLYTGLSGLGVNQTRLNVIGNNIANVNTTAFKASRAIFKPQFYVTDGAGSPPSGDFGGSNPSQRGLGAAVASIDKDWTPGTIDPTGRATDLAISGPGFFIVNDGEDKYTRDGAFDLNANNELISSQGKYVMGYGVDENFNVIEGQLQRMNIPLNQLTIAEATRALRYTGNLNANGTLATGASILQSAPLTVAGGAAAPNAATLLTDLRPATDPNGPAMFAVGQQVNLNITRNGARLEQGPFEVTPATTVGEFMDYLRFASHIDTSAEVTAAAPAGYVPGVGLNSPSGDPANSIRLNVTGNVGAANSLAISDTAIGLNFGLNAASNPVGESRSTFITGYDSLGNPVDVRVTLALESRTSAGTTWRYFASSPDDTDLLTYDGANNPGAILGSGVLSFDNGGRLISATNTNIAVTRENTGAEPLLNIDLDFTSLTALADVTSTFRPDPRAELAGVRTGTLTSFSIAEDGTISGSFDNGLERPLGRLVLAQFDNAEGLIDLGGNNFRTGPSSGQPILTDPGSIGSGTVLAGRLEQSNVDISREFINMIITTTGYSASSRVISTSDRLLTELLNVSR